MKKTNYIVLVEQLAETTGYDKRTVREIMDAFIDKVRSLKDEGDSIVLKKLGKFEIRRRNKKQTKLNGKTLTIGPRRALYFEVFREYIPEEE